MVWKKDYPVVEGLIKGEEPIMKKQFNCYVTEKHGQKIRGWKKDSGTEKLKRHSSTHSAKQIWKWIGPLDIYPHALRKCKDT